MCIEYTFNMLSASLRRNPELEINPRLITDIAPTQTSPTYCDLKNNTSMFDPSAMSQTPPGIFTNTLKERMRMYYLGESSNHPHKK